MRWLFGIALALVAVAITWMVISPSYKRALEAAKTMETPSKEYVGSGFRIQLETSVRTTSESPVEDFTLYNFRLDSGETFHAYSGNQPEFPSQGHSVSDAIETTLPSGLSRQCIKASRGGKFSNECLVFLDQPFPSMLHVWYQGLDGPARGRVEQMIETLDRTGSEEPQ